MKKIPSYYDMYRDVIAHIGALEDAMKPKAEPRQWYADEKGEEDEVGE